MIHEAFQRCLNATALTAGHHGFAPVPAYRQNAFRALATNETNEESINKSITTQVAAMTYQSQLMANTAANTSIRQEQQMAYLAAQQQLMHENMHQLIAGLNAVIFNQSNAGQGTGRFSAHGYGGRYGGRARGCGDYRFYGHGWGPPEFGYSPTMNFPPSIVRKQGFPPGIPPPPGGVQAYYSPTLG
jgi:hypothetical protein